MDHICLAEGMMLLPVDTIRIVDLMTDIVAHGTESWFARPKRGECNR